MINFFIFSQLKKPITIEDNKKQNERTIYKPPESLESLMRTQMSSKLGSFLYDSEANEEQKSKDINEPNPSTSEAQLNDLLLLSSTRTFRHCLGDSQSCGLAKELYFSLLQWLSVEANYYQQLGKGMVERRAENVQKNQEGLMRVALTLFEQLLPLNLKCPELPSPLFVLALLLYPKSLSISAVSCKLIIG